MSTIRHSLVAFVNGSNSYFTRNVSDMLTLQNQSSGTAIMGLFGADETSNNAHRVYLVGSPTSLTNTESLYLGTNRASTRFEIRSDVSGTGAARALALQSGANTDQLVLGTDGVVSLSGTTNSTSISTGTLVLSNGGLGVSGNIYAGGSGHYFTGASDGQRSVNFQNTSSGSNANITLFMRGDASNGWLLKNSSTRTANGGAHAMTLRNEDGPLVLNVTVSGVTRGITVNSTSVSLDATTTSTSSATGGLLLSGGLGIATTIDSVSSTNGGAATIAGGLAVAKKIYGGTQAFIGTTVGAGILNLANNSGTDASPALSLMRSNNTAGGSLYISSADAVCLANTVSGQTLRLETNGGAVAFIRSGTTLLTTNINGTNVYRQLMIGSSTDNYSSSPGTTARFLSMPSATWTDSGTAASGTAAQDYISARFSPMTVAAANASVTTTNATTFIVEGPPVAGANQTLTNRYAMQVNSGQTRFNETTATTSASTGSLIIAGGVNITNTTDSASGTEAGALLVQGGVSVSKKLRVGGISYFGAEIDMLSNKITQLANPTSAQDAATKYYVDGVAQGLRVKDAVVARTAAAGTLASSFANGSTIDGVVIATGERILIANQANGVENGIYTVNASGAPTRVLDFNTGAPAASAFVFVQKGTQYADSGWVCTNDSGSDVVGTDALVFVQFSGAGQVVAGDALSKTGNQLDVVVDNVSLEISADALQFKSSFAGTGLSVVDGELEVDTALTHVTEVGTLGGGSTWQAQIIAVTYGGTGAASFTAGKLLYGDGSSALQVDNTLDFDPETKVFSADHIVANTSINAGLSNPTVTLSATDLVNITNTSSITTRNSKMFKNGDQNIVRVTFEVTPISGNTRTEFRFSVPNFAVAGNTYDIVGSVNGWHVTNDVNVENAFVLANTSTNNVRVVFTAVDNTAHILQLIIYYTTAVAP